MKETIYQFEIGNLVDEVVISDEIMNLARNIEFKEKEQYKASGYWGLVGAIRPLVDMKLKLRNNIKVEHLMRQLSLIDISHSVAMTLANALIILMKDKLASQTYTYQHEPTRPEVKVIMRSEVIKTVKPDVETAVKDRPPFFESKRDRKERERKEAEEKQQKGKEELSEETLELGTAEKLEEKDDPENIFA